MMRPKNIYRHPYIFKDQLSIYIFFNDWSYFQQEESNQGGGRNYNMLLHQMLIKWNNSYH